MTQKRKWFTDEEYMQGLGLAQLLPGAALINFSSYLGFRLRGLPGAATATVFFLVPCFLLMLLLSHLYFRYGNIPIVHSLFHGLGALVFGLIFNTMIDLWRLCLKTFYSLLMALTGFAMVFCFKMGIVKILLIAGTASVLQVFLTSRFPALSRWTEIRSNSADDKFQQTVNAGKVTSGIDKNNRFVRLLMNLFRTRTFQTQDAQASDHISACSQVDLSLHWHKIALLVFWLVVILAADLILIQQRPELVQMSYKFLQIGACTFGGGYVMLPFIQDAVVNQFGWLTNPQFAAALALSLVTPGPVTVIGTFIGYKVAGVTGALAGMVNMYYPAWALTTLLTTPYARAGRLGYVKRMISGIVAAFIGTLAVVLINLASDTLVDIPAMAMASGAFITQRYMKIDTVWIVTAGTLVSIAVFH